MRKLKYLLASVVVGTSLCAATASAEDLLGTIWASSEDYSWITVSEDGDIKKFTSAGHYVQILDQHGSVYAIKIAWWNGMDNRTVEEFGVMIPLSDDLFVYREAGLRETTPGMLGEGYLQFNGPDSAQFTQIGPRRGGSVSALANSLTRVETVPQFE